MVECHFECATLPHIVMAEILLINGDGELEIGEKHFRSTDLDKKFSPVNYLKPNYSFRRVDRCQRE